MTPKIAFFGTGDFAVPALKALCSAGRAPVLVICQPDRPKGRGHQLQAPPVKQAAEALGLRVWQPERMRDPESESVYLAEGLDLACVVAYGQILSQAALDAPAHGSVNLHASLLPRWRGAAPIEWALASGDAETGVCVQKMAYRLDAGDVLLSHRHAIAPDEDGPGLHALLAEAGAGLLVEAVDGLLRGALHGVRQDEGQVTLAPLLKKSDGYIDFSGTRRELLNRFRAFKERPGVSTAWEGGDTLKVLALADAGGQGGSFGGTLLEIAERGLRVGCRDGSVWLEQVRPPSGKAMGASDYARGRRLATGARFTAPGQ